MLQWDSARIADLINAQVTEGQSLEFKGNLPAKNDRDKAEFLKDVSALANAIGGAILFGISEKEGTAASLTGLQLSDYDAEVRRLSQILESGTEPRIAGIQFSKVLLDDGEILVVDVPQSFDAPHRYLFNGHSKFVQRVGSHVSELTYDQLRSAFDRSSERLSRIREQWAADFGLTRSWKPFEAGPVCVVRVSSLLAADGRQIIDPQAAEAIWSCLIQSDWGGGSPAYNYEGLVVAPGRDGDAVSAYTQVHRIGALTGYRVVGQEWEGEQLFISGRAESFIREILRKAINFLIAQNIAGSAIVHIGITRLKGYKLAFTSDGFSRQVLGNVEELELPELLIDDLSSEIDLHSILKPGFDLVWQAYGQPRCKNYRPDGIWEIR